MGGPSYFWLLIAATRQRPVAVGRGTEKNCVERAIRYLAGNSLALARQRRSKAAPRVVRFLDEDLSNQVKAAISAMPLASGRERAGHARARWLFGLLFLSGLRISEVVNNTMGNFFCRADKGGEPPDGGWRSPGRATRRDR